MTVRADMPRPLAGITAFEMVGHYVGGIMADIVTIRRIDWPVMFNRSNRQALGGAIEAAPSRRQRRIALCTACLWS